jgi:hypothetical protein
MCGKGEGHTPKKQIMIEFTARGIQENDGRTFKVHVTSVVGGADVTNIVFR